MYRTLTTVALTVLAVLFSIQNFDNVPLYFFWGKPIQIRLIFIIAVAAVIGYVIRHYIGIVREEALKRRLKAALKMNSDLKANNDPDKDFF